MTDHAVQVQIVEVLINRGKRIPSALRATLRYVGLLWATAGYDAALVRQNPAARRLRRRREFVTAVR